MEKTYAITTKTHTEIICTCGHHSMKAHYLCNHRDIYQAGPKTCPSCGNKIDLMMIADSFYGNKMTEDIVARLDVSVTSHCAFHLKVTRFKFHNDDHRYMNPDKERLSLTERDHAELDIDLTRYSQLATLSINGKEMKPTKSNITKALAYVNASCVPKTVFSVLSDRMSTSTLAMPVNFLLEHPYFEKFYMADEKLLCYTVLHDCTEKLDETAAKPHQIMRLTKKQYQLYMPHITAFHSAGMSYPGMLRLKGRISEAELEKFFELSWEIACRDPRTNIPSGWIQLVTADYVNFELDTLFDYLTDKIYTYQGISSVMDGSQLLADYHRLCNLMGVQAEKYPKSLKLRHDLASKNYKVVVKEEETKAFMQAISVTAYQQLAYKDKDYTVLVPKDPQDVIFEGAYLGHCVGSYIDKIAHEGVEILFMRRTGKEHLPLVTLDVRKGRLTQAAGAGNRSLSKDEAAFVAKWVKAKKLETIVYL